MNIFLNRSESPFDHKRNYSRSKKPKFLTPKNRDIIQLFIDPQIQQTKLEQTLKEDGYELARLQRNFSPFGYYKYSKAVIRVENDQSDQIKLPKILEKNGIQSKPMNKNQRRINRYEMQWYLQSKEYDKIGFLNTKKGKPIKIQDKQENQQNKQKQK